MWFFFWQQQQKRREIIFGRLFFWEVWITFFFYRNIHFWSKGDVISNLCKNLYMFILYMVVSNILLFIYIFLFVMFIIFVTHYSFIILLSMFFFVRPHRTTALLFRGDNNNLLQRERTTPTVQSLVFCSTQTILLIRKNGICHTCSH